MLQRSLRCDSNYGSPITSCRTLVSGMFRVTLSLCDANYAWKSCIDDVATSDVFIMFFIINNRVSLLIGTPATLHTTEHDARIGCFTATLYL